MIAINTSLSLSDYCMYIIKYLFYVILGMLFTFSVHAIF